MCPAQPPTSATTFFPPLENDLSLCEQGTSDLHWPPLPGIESTASAFDFLSTVGSSSASLDLLSAFASSPPPGLNVFQPQSTGGHSSTTPSAVDSSSSSEPNFSAAVDSSSSSALDCFSPGASSSLAIDLLPPAVVNPVSSSRHIHPPAIELFTIAPPTMSAAPRRPRDRRPRTPSKKSKTSAADNPPPVELANGLILSDSPPGKVGRYLRLSPGAWLVARVLLYKFSSFPRLWLPSPASSAAQTPDEDGARGFHYNWVDWLTRLSAMRTDAGPWRDAALAVAALPVHVTAATVEDAAKAVIELALRDAEVERAALRPPVGPAAAAEIADERAFMARARTATTYAPRATAIQRCFFTAIEACNASLLQRIADESPPEHIVRTIIQNGGF